MSEQFDLVIRNGSIVDGTGSAPFAGDVAVRDGLIVQVGKVDGTGREEIDAAGCSVTPGFVDVHTHYDGQITWESRMSPSSSHGVTTVVMGNCGVGFAPVHSTDHQLVIKLMEGVEDIPEVVMAEGIPWNWNSFPEYLDAIDQRVSDIDFAAQLPHSPLRVFVMRERGADMEEATEADLAEMRRLTTEAIQAGALGVTTSRNLFHRFRDGKLAPSVTTGEDELVALAAGLKDAGTGVFQCIPRLENEPEAEMNMLKAVARVSGRPVNFSLIPLPTIPGIVDKYTTELDKAAAEGLDINAHYMPRPLGVLMGLDLSYHPFSLNPSYRPIANLSVAEKVARMRDPEFRKQLLSEKPDDPNPAFVNIVSLRNYLYPISDPVDYHFNHEDSLNAKAEASGLPIDEVIYDALLEDDGRAIIGLFPTDGLSYIDDTAQLANRADTVLSLGDGGAHYSMICDAAYTSYMLSQRVGVNGLTLPDLIKRLTSRSAQSVGLLDRGVIAPGYKADLNVIDVDNIVVYRPVIRNDLPTGGKRLSQRADGYKATIVSGVVTYRDSEPTGELPGRLIRGAKAAPSPVNSVAEALA